MQYIGRPGSREETNFVLQYQVGNIVPADINQVSLGIAIVAPYSLRFDLWAERFVPYLNLLAFGPPIGAESAYSPNASLLWAEGGYVAATLLDPLDPLGVSGTTAYGIITYSGFKITSFSFVRNGNFASATMSFQDSASTFVFNAGRITSDGQGTFKTIP